MGLVNYDLDGNDHLTTALDMTNFDSDGGDTGYIGERSTARELGITGVY